MFSYLNLISILAIISFCNCTTNESTIKNDLESINLNGQVKKVIQNSFKENFPLAKGKPYIVSTDQFMFHEGEKSDYQMEFTKEGYKKEFINYRYSHKPGEREVRNNIIYQYTNANRLLKEAYRVWDDVNKKYFTRKERLFDYDKNGFKKSMRESFGKNVRNEYKYIYDANSNLIKEEYIPNKRLKSITKYEYDDFNNKISEEKFKIKRDGNVQATDYKITYGYDKLNRKITQTEYVGYINQTTKFTYSYNDSGNISTILRTVFNEKVIMNFDYEYDHKRNWVKKYIKIDSKIQYQINREISYY